MPSKLISSRDSVPTVPLTPRRASVRRNLSSRKVARPSRYSGPRRADQLPRRRSRWSCLSKIDHRSIVVRTCRVVSCQAVVTRHYQAAVDAIRPVSRSFDGREGIARSRDASQAVCVRAVERPTMPSRCAFWLLSATISAFVEWPRLSHWVLVASATTLSLQLFIARWPSGPCFRS